MQFVTGLIRMRTHASFPSLNNLGNIAEYFIKFCVLRINWPVLTAETAFVGGLVLMAE